MELNIIIRILVLDIVCFALGIIAGAIYKKRWQKVSAKKSLSKDADWQTLMNYYPTEPTEFLSLNKQNKGEKGWKKKMK